MKKIALVAIPVVLASTHAFASGFSLNEQSAATQGTAGAGSGIEDSPSVQFTNPAGLGFLPGTRMMVGGTVYFTHTAFSNTGSSSLLGAFGPPLSGTTTQAVSDPTIFAPDIYISQSIGDQFAVGLGVSAPFGLKTLYDGASDVRYFALNTYLQTIDINPNIAFKPMPNLSLGAGLIVRHSTATFSNAVDFGSLGAANLIPGSIPQGQDGYAQVTGTSWATGYKLGLEYIPVEGTKIGLSYRSHVSTTLKGTATFTTPGPGAVLEALTGAFQNTTASAAIDYPEEATLSVGQAITPKWMVMGDVTYTNWSNFKQLAINFGNPFQPTAVTQENWNNSYRISVGTTYDVTDALTLRTGFAYDNSPVPDAADLTPRVPDADRYWIAFGAGYKFDNGLAFNAAWAHLFFADTNLVQQSATAGVIQGNYSGSQADLLTFDLSYKF